MPVLVLRELSEKAQALKEPKEEFFGPFCVCLHKAQASLIDMLPIVKRGSEKLIGGMILDIFSLASMMKKPLGLRVLPIPESRAGDWTRFKHLFFTNTAIVDSGTGISIHQLPSQVDDSIFRF